MKLTCADPTCERAPMRQRDGQRWCMWHPEQTAPDIDMLSGKLRGPDGKPKKDPKPSEILRPSTETAAKPPTYRAPGRVVVRQPQAEAPADGRCPADGCTRPYRHRGVHSSRTVPTPTADGLCATEGCDRPWRHTGKHRQPKATPAPRPARTTWSNAPKTTGQRPGRQPNPFDPAEAARRYLAGEGLFPLAADLHIGTNTLRRALADQGVTLRKRGDVIGTRVPAPTPIDPEQVRQLYLDQGLNTGQIARQLNVKTNRVQDLLRAMELLRPPGGRHPGAGAVNSVRLKLGADLSQQVRLRAASLGKPIGHYLRDLVLTDLAAVATNAHDEVA